MRSGALDVLWAATYIVVVGAHPVWDRLVNKEQPSPMREKKCTACQTIRLFKPGDGGTINHPTQAFIASMSGNLMPRERFRTSHHTRSASVAKILPELEKEGVQKKSTDEKIHELFPGPNVTNDDQSILNAKHNFPRIKRKGCHILKCLSLHQALLRLQQNSSKIHQNSLIFGTMSRIRSKDLQDIADIRDQIKIYCKCPKTAIKERMRKLIDARNQPDNGRTATLQLLRHKGVNITSPYENPTNIKPSFQEAQISTTKPIGSIGTTQSETKDKINMKNISTPSIILSTLATIRPQIAENLLLGTTEATSNWDFNETVTSMNKEQDEVTSSSDEPYPRPTTDGNNNFQASITKFKSMNVTSAHIQEILPGRILFLYKDQTIPMFLIRTENGTTVLGIDGDYLCNRTMHNPLRYETKFSKLCFI